MKLFIARLFVSTSLFLAFFSLSQAAPPHGDPYRDVFGKWQIVDLVGGADIAPLSDSQARALIGKPFSVSAERFVFNGKTCTNPNYKRRIVQAAKYFRDEWHANSSGLPVPNPTTIIENDCYDLFLARKGHLIIAVEGLFFEAARSGKSNDSGKSDAQAAGQLDRR